MSLQSVLLILLGWNLLLAASAFVFESVEGFSFLGFGEGSLVTFYSGFQLLLLSWIAFKVLQSRRSEEKALWKSPAFVWVLITSGFLFLAADELLALHEMADGLIHDSLGLTETGLTDRIDDAIIGLFGLIGLGVLVLYRSEFTSFGGAYRFFGLGFAFLFIMVGFDVLTNRNDLLPKIVGEARSESLFLTLSHVEEVFKLYSEAFFILAFTVIFRGSVAMDRDEEKVPGHGEVALT
ncbi:MAG: hypothetical protein Q7Q71_07160 [Verrucomicrobiota bacterium JB023]|nr:hypothetical protein [Verrucomicrobiota bacterium JB023]